MEEAGRQKPSKGFSHRVMAAVERSRSSISAYQPVISPLAMRLIFGGLAVFYAVVLFFSPEQTGGSRYMQKLKAFTEKNSLDVPEVSLPTFSIPQLDWSFFGTSPVLAYGLLALAVMTIIMAGRSSSPVAFSQNR